MYIERNGKKIELTSEELRLAHEEYEHESVKEDLASVFARDYLGFDSSGEFEEFVEDLSSNEGFPSDDFLDAYDELCDSFGKETVSWLVNNPEDFLDEAYRIYDKNLDANEDFNSQVEYAVKSILCDKSFEFKLYKVQEALKNGKVFPGDVCFSFKGMWIANPFLDETGRFEVDPVEYYGSVNVSRYIELFNEKASDNYIKDVLWRDVEGFDTKNLKNFMNETPAGIDLCPDYRVFVCGDEITAEKNTIGELVHVPCYHVFAREISSEKHIVSLRTVNLSREGFNECVEGVLVGLNAYNKFQIELSAKAAHKDLYEKALVDYCELSQMVDRFGGSFEELCVKLGGQNYDGELFDVNFGVLCATVEDNGGSRWVSTESVDVWNDSMDSMIEESVSLSRLIEICSGLGIDVDYSRSADGRVELGSVNTSIKATTIYFTTTEGPDATQFDTQDQAEVLELFGQFLKENNFELVSIDSIEPCEIVEKVENITSVDEMLNNAKQTCEELNKGNVGKNDVDLGKE